jgi:regulator of sirC expression with transglutaminase-like and TPR domain
MKDINHSLDLLPTNSYAYKNRALVYFDLAEKNKGCADLEKAIELGYTKQYGNKVEKLNNEKCKY